MDAARAGWTKALKLAPDHADKSGLSNKLRRTRHGQAADLSTENLPGSGFSRKVPRSPPILFMESTGTSGVLKTIVCNCYFIDIERDTRQNKMALKLPKPSFKLESFHVILWKPKARWSVSTDCYCVRSQIGSEGSALSCNEEVIRTQKRCRGERLRRKILISSNKSKEEGGI